MCIRDRGNVAGMEPAVCVDDFCSAFRVLVVAQHDGVDVYKRQALDGAPHGTLVLTAHQSAGRGRLVGGEHQCAMGCTIQRQQLCRAVGAFQRVI